MFALPKIVRRRRVRRQRFSHDPRNPWLWSALPALGDILAIMASGDPAALLDQDNR
jgi:hypothetical protein